MADKRYYWFKMERSFFEQKEIKYLRRLPGGDTYTIIYLKLILKSLENNGKIYYENIGDDYTEEWALEIEEDEKAVSFLVGFLINKGLMIDCGSDEFEITKTRSLVGSETASAERKRRQREREKEPPLLGSVTNSQESVTMSQVSHTEKELEKEIKKEKELDSDKDKEKEDSNSQNQLQKLVSLFEVELGSISPTAIEELRTWIFVDNFSSDIIQLALKEAVLNHKVSMNYIKGILRNWRNEGITSAQEVKQMKKERYVEKSHEDFYIPMDGPWNGSDNQ